jgi:autotransporter-associated beta strand protein
MTTASTRAVSSASYSRLRVALLAATSAGALLTLSSPASAASCATTGGADTCVITLANVPDTHDGQGGSDTLDFQGTPLSLSSSLFTTESGARFINFENAVVTAGNTLLISDTDADAVRNLNWTIDGLLDLNFASTATNNDTIGDGSAVTVNAGGSISLWESETIGSLAGAGDVVFVLGSSPVLTTGGNGNNTVFTGNITGLGGLTKIGAGTMELNSNNTITGALTVAGGVLEIGHAGAIDDVSSVTITSGSTLSGETAYTINAPVTITTTSLTPTPTRLTGNATINGNVSSNGGLQPGNTSIPPGGTVENPGQDMGTITINGNYTSTGTSAYVGMFVDVDAALAAPVNGTTHDFLNIQGNITGTNRTMLSHVSFLNNPVGGPTTGNGIQLVRVTGTSSPNDFYQATAIAAGPYQYLLRHVPNYNVGLDDGFFLQSAVRDELIAHAALLSAGQELVRSCYNDGQRIPDSPKGATYGRAWVGYRQGSTDFGADTGIDSNVDFSCTTGGMDWRMGNGWFGGVSGGFGDTEGNILTPAGEAKYTGTGRTAEVFASFTSEALFINLSVGYNAMDYTYDGALMFPVLAETSGLLGRAETGVAIDLDAIAVKLIGAVSYDGTSCDNSCLGVTATEETGLLEAKGTVRIDGVAHGGSIRPWIAASFSDVLSDGINTVSLGGITVTHDTNGQRLSLDAGLKAYLDQNFALYLDGGYQESLSTDVTGYKAGIGLKMYW